MGNIPENITREHILKAIEEIDRDGVPPKKCLQNMILSIKIK